MNRLLLLLGMAGLLLAAGCRKDDVVECAPATTTSALDGFTQRNGVPVQTFSLPLGLVGTFPQTVTTSGGAVITFPTTSFLLPNGTMATGIAQVRVREIYSVPNMILSNMPTQEAGSRRLLVSGGEFSIQVWQNGSRLRLAAGTPRVVVNSIPPAGTGTGQMLVWQQLATSIKDSAAWSRPTTLDTVRTVSTTAPVYSMPIPLDSVSWWNIDRVWQLYQNATMGTVVVRVPALPTGSSNSTVVFMRPVGYNSVGKLYPSASSVTWSAQLPVGVNMVAIVLQSVNGQLYYGTQPFAAQNGLILTPSLTAVSEADAVRLIKQL